MNEQFKSSGEAGVPAVAEAPSPDVLANQELAKVMQDSRVMQIIQYTGTLHQLLPVTVIENQTQYDQVIDAFDSAKKLIKLIDARRHEIVDFPTKTVKLINNLFKQLEGNVEIAKNHFGALIEAKKQFDAKQYALGQQEQKETTTAPVEDGVGKVEFGGEDAPAPGNVVQSARGAKTHSRTDIEVTVTDPVKFLKLIVSTNKRYSEFTPELVEIKLGAVKKLIKEGSKRSVPGLKIEKTSTTV